MKSEYQRLTATKASREACAAKLILLAESLGASVTRGDYQEPREISLRVALGPYRASIDLDATCPLSGFLIHWHMALDSNATYPRDFGFTCGGSVNEYHWRKATTCVETFAQLLDRLEAGLRVCASRIPALA